MWPSDNYFHVVGWVERIHRRGPDDFAFRLIEPAYFEHFSAAAKEQDRLLVLDVQTTIASIANLCRERLEVGHRVQVFGRLRPVKAGRGPVRFGVDAWKIERAEPLEAFRYVNHRWDYERAESSAPTPQALRLSVVADGPEQKGDVS